MGRKSLGGIMKPIELRIKNIGPFKDETIDFSKLENMFIITGNTGAGKTFIFDAMTYALYGVLRGNRTNHEKEIKSRYAAPDETEFFVELKFQIGSRIYRVKRTVEYTKPGNKTVTSAKVDFFHINDDGTEECLSAKNKSDTDESIRKIIGLTAAEFSQVILLPQGAFAEFLKQNSNEKRKTLEKLFPVQDYTKLIEAAEAKDKEFDGKIKEKEAVIGGRLKSAQEKGYDFSDAVQIISDMKSEIKAMEDEERKLNEQKVGLSAQTATLKRDLDDSKKNEENLRNLEDMLSRESGIRKMEEVTVLAEKANSLKEFISVNKSAIAKKQSAVLKFQDAEKNFSEKKSELDALKTDAPEMEALERKNIETKTMVDSLNEKLKKAGEYADCVRQEALALDAKKTAEKKYAEITNRLEEVKASLQGEKIEDKIQRQNDIIFKLKDLLHAQENLKADAEKRDMLIKDVESLSESAAVLAKEKEENEDKVRRTENTLAAKKQESEDFKIRNSAFSIAKILKPGAPCPVCGSMEHPAPATNVDGLLNPEEQIPLFEQALNDARRKLGNVENRLSGVNAEKAAKEKELEKYSGLDDTETIIGVLSEIRSKDSSASLAKQELEKMRNDISILMESQKDADDSFNAADKEYASVHAKKVSLEHELGDSVESLRARFDELSRLYNNNVNICKTWTERKNNAESEFASAGTALENCRQAVEDSTIECETAEKNLKLRLNESDFASVEEAENAMMAIPELTRQRNECREFNERLHSLKDAVENARKLKPSAEIQMELDGIKARQQVTEAAELENRHLLDLKNAELHDYQNYYEEIGKYSEEKKRLEAERLPYKKLFEDLSGTNRAKVPFDVWALGMYFEQVVDFASERFFEISNHRFEFVLKDLEDRKGGGYKGLELQVMDHNTPAQSISDTANLSGGETFEASISLALAVTDVVQNNNGGIILDSLFIDEGFGTLDPEPLESTMSVLNELSGKKMIGLISHVDSLQNSDSGITSRLYVDKTSHGSTVKIL